MEITSTPRSDAKVPVTVVHIKGDLDVKSHGDFENHIRQLHANGTRHIVLDVQGVRYISSAGLRAIHSMFNLLRQEDAEESDSTLKKGVREGVFKSKHLKLAAPNRNVEQVITMAGYDMFMEIHPDVETAVRSF
jgi:anti-anti-sigma factor